MGIIKPATPGFLVTLTATILLAVVSFCVPYIKSVYFLKATIDVSGVNGSIIFGTLGFCLELSNGTTCSKPAVGYSIDINSLVGNTLPVQIPTVVVKWLTDVLVLHIVALCLAAIASFFGLLAHVREMSMVCFSSCISGTAASVALLAFIFDLVLFFVAKARINDVGSAQIGPAVWLTLAAWMLLFFSGCFFAVGRCCISRRPSRSPVKNGGGGSGLYVSNDNERPYTAGHNTAGFIDDGNRNIVQLPPTRYGGYVPLDADNRAADVYSRQDNPHDPPFQGHHLYDPQPGGYVNNQVPKDAANDHQLLVPGGTYEYPPQLQNTRAPHFVSSSAKDPNQQQQPPSPSHWAYRNNLDFPHTAEN